jgi:DNA polymerase
VNDDLGLTREQIRRQAREHLVRLQSEGVWALAGPIAEPKAPADVAGPVVAATSETVAAAPESVSDSRTGTETLADVEAEARGCTACDLCRERTKVVFGVGNPDARLMFIGEGPGRDEDLRGEPFVGAAGQVLDRIIVAMGLQRPEVYIANAVKCRPPRNRNPEPRELAACRHFLLRQVALIKPELVVVLGRVAAQVILDSDAPLGRLRGRFHDWNGIPVMCTYHPAYLLRNPADKRKTWEDIQQVMARLGGTR